MDSFKRVTCRACTAVVASVGLAALCLVGCQSIPPPFSMDDTMVVCLFEDSNIGEDGSGPDVGGAVVVNTSTGAEFELQYYQGLLAATEIPPGPYRLETIIKQERVYQKVEYWVPSRVQGRRSKTVVVTTQYDHPVNDPPHFRVDSGVVTNIGFLSTGLHCHVVEVLSVPGDMTKNAQYHLICSPIDLTWTPHHDKVKSEFRAAFRRSLWLDFPWIQVSL